MLALWIVLNAENNIPRIPLKEYAIEGSPEAATVWSLKTIFTSNKAKDIPISSYKIEGDSPCTIQNGSIFVKEYSTHFDSYKINDFAVIDSTLYYLSNFKVYSMDINKLAAKVAVERKKVLDMAPYKFTSMRVANFSNNELVFFFMNKGLELFYVPLEPSSGEAYSLSTTNIQLRDINEHTKITTYKDFIFIPSGRQGLLVYKYDTTKKLLEHIKTFDFTEDVRDFALLKFGNAVMGAIADYTKGLILFNIKFPSIDASDINTYNEFSNVKSLALIKKTNKVKILILFDYTSQISKYTLITLNKQYELSQDYTKVLEATSHYLDAYNYNAAIIMSRSISIVDLNEDVNDSKGSIWNQEISNARIHYMKDQGELLFGVGDMKLFLAEIVQIQRHLVCHKGADDYNFTVIGRSTDCSQVGSGQNCDYQVKVEYKVAKKKVEKEEKKKTEEGGFSGMSLFLLFLFIIPATVVLTLVIKNYTERNMLSRGYNEVVKETGSITKSHHSSV